MKFILKRYLLTIASIFIVTQMIASFSVNNGWYGFFYVSLTLSILFYIIRPILNLIMFPINLLTLNLSNWLIQIVIFYVWTLVSPIKIDFWHFGGLHIGPITLSNFDLLKWQVTILSALTFIIINKLLNWLFK